MERAGQFVGKVFGTVGLLEFVRIIRGKSNHSESGFSTCRQTKMAATQYWDLQRLWMINYLSTVRNYGFV